jgi:hypothetical protein
MQETPSDREPAGLQTPGTCAASQYEYAHSFIERPMPAFVYGSCHAVEYTSKCQQPPTKQPLQATIVVQRMQMHGPNNNESSSTHNQQPFGLRPYNTIWVAAVMLDLLLCQSGVIGVGNLAGEKIPMTVV